MPDVRFTVERVAAARFAASPTISIELAIENAPAGERIDSILLRAQVRIEAADRAYDAAERERLREVFGGAAEWERGLRGLLWAPVTLVVPRFAGRTLVEVAVPCPFDPRGAATKYLQALSGADVPLALLFGGTIFHVDDTEALRAAPVRLDVEARARMSLAVYRDAIAEHGGGVASIDVATETFERLSRYRTERGARSWDETIASLLPREERPS
jgi:hypothetical protein